LKLDFKELYFKSYFILTHLEIKTTLEAAGEAVSNRIL
jgi:hypothetical protein